MIFIKSDKGKLKKAIHVLNEREKKLLKKSVINLPFKSSLKNKIPLQLVTTMEKTFIKSFEILFNKGTSAIEKTFHKEDLQSDYRQLDELISNHPTKNDIKLLNNKIRKTNGKNKLLTTVSGFGLGALGIGIPDIFILTSTMLKGIYQTAISCGFSYDNENDKKYILRLIRTALSLKENRETENSNLDSENYYNTTLKEEITMTAKALSNALLFEKFVQGIPLVGIVGGFVNNSIYKQVISFSSIKYQKKYLTQKLQKPM